MSTPTLVKGSNVPKDALLGHVSFQQIDDIRIHKDDLALLFDKHGLSRNFMPDEIKPHDAYRRATKTAQQQIEIDDGSGNKQKARLMVREVKYDHERIVRHLVREIVDGKNEALDYATVGKLEFDRIQKDIIISWDINYLNEYDYRKVLEDTKDLFKEWTQFHTKDTVRNIVNKIIQSTNPVSIQKGGRATFIPKAATDLLMSAKDMVAELPGNTSSIEVLPLIDSDDTRDLVKRRAEESFRDEIRELALSFDHLLAKNTTLTKEQVARYAAKYAVLKERTVEYAKLVKTSFNVLEDQVREALERISEASEEAAI